MIERRPNWLRGVLEPCLLALLREGPAHGYELAGRLEAAGLGTVPGGSLYPALARLAERGAVVADWQAGDGGPGRKVYAITDDGRRQLAEQADAWAGFAASVGGLLLGAEAP
ncbi:MAG: PadR family transcriptional regulator [Acidimicrobiales bacterium]